MNGGTKDMARNQQMAQARGKEGHQTERVKRTRLTQKVIVEAAAGLFAWKGFGATSLNDIAEALGVTKVALYYHIKNKEEILRLIYLMVLNMAEEPLRHIAESELSPVEKLRRAVEHHISVTVNTSPAIKVFYREHAHLTGPFAREIMLREKDYERYIEQIIQEGIAKGIFKPDFDPQVITFGLLGMCHWLSQWYKPSGRYTHRQIASMFMDMVEGGLLLVPSTEIVQHS